MRILVDLDQRRQVIELAAWRPSAALGHLLERVGCPVDDGDVLFLDHVQCTPATLLRELVLLDGSVVSREPPADVRPVQGWNVSVAGGESVAPAVLVPMHRPLVVGRAPQADIVVPSASASWEHCTIEIEDAGVRIRDCGSTNGTDVDGQHAGPRGVLVTGTATVVIGGAVLLVRESLHDSPAPRPGSLHNVNAAGTAPFNRPPRRGDLEASELVVPPIRKEVPAAARFNVITVVAPLALAIAMVVIMGDPRFAAFAALSPVMAVGMWFEQRHRRARNLSAEASRFDRALADFHEAIADASCTEATRRRELAPDPSTVLRRALLPSTLLWQRRPDSNVFLLLHVGVGDEPWEPAVDTRGVLRIDPAVAEIVTGSKISAAPVLVDLTEAGVIGIVGERQGALALARSLMLQATVHCGPADLTVGVFCDGGREEQWSWASWLPHTKNVGSEDGGRLIFSGRERSSRVLRGLQERLQQFPTPVLLLVLDSEALTDGRDAPARELLGTGRSTESSARRPESVRVCGIVIAATADQLPAACTAVVTVSEDSAACVEHLGRRTVVDDVVLAGVSIVDAEDSSRRLAHLEDPELTVTGSTLPPLIRLPELLNLGVDPVCGIQKLWNSGTGLSTPIGLGENGPLTLDLVADGPHGLVGGTTGSGKSEFLRSFVAGLAARNDPTKLNFILIDFKGGAAFAACERLPHTVGTISNLDEQLADRALRSLEAEMHRRQRLFAEAGDDVDNLDAYLATCPTEPLPRLLLVIDEFAMLAKDYPDVLSSLVSVGAVGRTLGVHMILATQRPAGVVTEDILANTNLRVALRVQSRDDSTSVIGVPSASSIGRAQTGRAFIKLGQDDITAVQTALVTGRARQALTDEVDVRDVSGFGVPLPPQRAEVANGDENDLDALIESIVEADRRSGFGRPRPVWPPALGGHVELSGLQRSATSDESTDRPGDSAISAAHEQIVAVALADEPSRQRQCATGWDLGQGNLLLIGVAGSGTTTTLASLALARARDSSPEELDLLVLDLGSGELAPLKDLPHTVAYVGPGRGAREHQARFLRYLREEFDRRRASLGSHRRMVVLVDGLAALREEFQDSDGPPLLEWLYRVYADGPSMGISFAVAVNRAKSVPGVMDEVTTQKWLFRLVEAYDYASYGIRGTDIPAVVPGRCVDVETRRQMQVAAPAIGPERTVDEVRGCWDKSPLKPCVVRTLPGRVPVDTIVEHIDFCAEPWSIPVGIREDTLERARLEIYQGEHVLVAGPSRSGKSNLLLAMIEVIRSSPSGDRPAIWAIRDRRSPLAGIAFDRYAETADDIPALIAGLRLETGPVVLVIDDAERIDDTDRSIANVIGSRRPGLLVIAAGRAGDLRALYGHWTNSIRASRCGVLLQPDKDWDGELLGVRLPRTPSVALTVGRGYVCVGGVASLAQTASVENA